MNPMARKKRRVRAWDTRTYLSLCVVLAAVSGVLALVPPPGTARSIPAISVDASPPSIAAALNSDSGFSKSVSRAAAAPAASQDYPSSLLINAIARENETANAIVPIEPATDIDVSDQSVQIGVREYSDMVHSLADTDAGLYLHIAAGIADIETDPGGVASSASESVENASVITQAVLESAGESLHASLGHADLELAQAASAFSDYETSYRLSRTQEVSPSGYVAGSR